jgi:predicted dehydrogenase
MRVVIAGYGIQGKKRKKSLKKNELVCVVDPIHKDAKYKYLEDVPKDLYDTVFICTPDEKKINLIEYCSKIKKNCLIEKPFPLTSQKKIKYLERNFNKNNLVCYVAYNHRFEPFIIGIKNYLKSKKLGKIYNCKLFYGNGTSKLVKKSKWKDKGLGVVIDLATHLLDMCNFWFGMDNKIFTNIHTEKFENKSPDNALIIDKIKNISFQLNVSYCMWKNDFDCDIIGKKGSLHLSSLSKWGKTILKIRTRVFPSGKPKEKIFSIKSKDPTWNSELIFFRKLIQFKKKNNLKKDIWINENLINFKKQLKIR